MGLVVLRHGEDRDHRDAAVLALLAARALIDGGEVRIHIAGIAAPAGHLLARGGYLAQRVGIVRDVRQNHEHMHILFKRQVFRGGQRHLRRGDPLDRGVVRKVYKEHGPFERAGLTEGIDEEIRLLKRDAHRSKYHSEGFIRPAHLCLPCDLGGEIGMR